MYEEISLSHMENGGGQARAQTFWRAGAQTKKRAPIAKMINEIKNNNNK